MKASCAAGRPDLSRSIDFAVRDSTTVRRRPMSLSRKLLAAAAVVCSVGAPGMALAQGPAQPPPPDATTAQPSAPAPEAAPPPAETVTPGATQAEETVAAPGAGKAKGKQFGEEIVVTGSRIRRKDLTTPAPVAVLSKEQIQASGKTSLGDFLQSLPEQGAALNTNVNNGGSGASRVNLR